jgi:GNAT superfamily N-acetyltransferase
MGGVLRNTRHVGAPIGMCAIKTGELHQIFVAPSGRGTGVAAALLADAEQRLLAQGDRFVSLHCLIENHAAIRFYSRHGWIEHGIKIAQLDTLDGPFNLPILLLRKELSAK